MLPPSHCDRIQEFVNVLKQLHPTVNSAPHNQEDISLSSTFQEVKKFFQEQIVSLTDDNLDSDDAYRMRSYLTEIHRLMRLLQMDMMFLQASRNPVTEKQRQSGMSDRIKTLIDYCEAWVQNQ